MLEADLLRDGEVVESAELWTEAFDDDTLEWASYDVSLRTLARWSFDELPRSVFEAEPNTLEPWSIRVRGTPLVLGTETRIFDQWRADRWWSGSVEVSLAEAIANENARFARTGFTPWQ